MFELTSTLPNFTFGKFSVVRKPIVNGGAIRPTGLLLCELGQLLIRFDFLGARRVIFSNVSTDSNLT